MSEPWQPAQEWTALPAGTVDVWRMQLRAGADDAAILSAEESAGARRIVIPAKAEQKSSARAHLRRILARYRGGTPDRLRFVYGEHGKPALADDPELSFNLSHSEHVGVLAVGRDLRVGVDVEHARPGRAFEDIAERFFSEPEYQALLAVDPERRPWAFYRAWTRKEAYLKAHGTGLSFASNRFTIDYLGDPGHVRSTEMPGDEPSRWRFVDLDVASGFAAALCVDRELTSLRGWEEMHR